MAEERVAPAFEPVVDRRFVLGEAPHWDGDAGEILWVDIVGRRAFAFRPADGRLRDWSFQDTVSAIVPRQGGGYAVATGRGAYALDPETAAVTALAEPDWEPASNRTNEARVDTRGRFWVASMANNIAPDGGEQPVREASGLLWCLDAGHGVRLVERDIGISNSLVWSPDETRMYFADTAQRVIWVYDWDADTGEASNRRVFAAPDGHGNPDGSAMDEAGCLWNARWGAGCIIRFRPDGAIDRIVEVPVQRPSSCVFGDGDRRTLYVTTATFGMPEAEQGTLDGCLLRVRTDVAGQPCTAYAG